jgi:hypothetical protein
VPAADWPFVPHDTPLSSYSESGSVLIGGALVGCGSEVISKLLSACHRYLETIWLRRIDKRACKRPQRTTYEPRAEGKTLFRFRCNSRKAASVTIVPWYMKDSIGK